MTSWSQLAGTRRGRHSSYSAFREEQLPSYVPHIPTIKTIWSTLRTILKIVFGTGNAGF